MRVGKRIAAAWFAACLLAASLSGCGGGTAVTDSEYQSANLAMAVNGTDTLRRDAHADAPSR